MIFSHEITHCLFLTLLTASASAPAGPRGSTSYGIPFDTTAIENGSQCSVTDTSAVCFDFRMSED